MQTTNDACIREMLLPFVQAEHLESSGTLLIQEFSIYGGSNRADLAALNGISHGYEIKSDLDTLNRLPSQVSAYSAIFEMATLVSGPKHLKAARAMIPKWWGIIEVKHSSADQFRLERVRQSRTNPDPHAESIAALLWRAEALALLESLGLDSGIRSKPMDQLVAKLAENLQVGKLASHVREALRARGDWRSAARLRRCDGKSPQLSNRSNFRRTPYGNIYR
jgi:hypothetical protein